MPFPDYVPLAVAATTGGLAGAVLTAIVTGVRSSRPKVEYETSVETLLRPRPDDSSRLSVEVIIHGEGAETAFTQPNLFLIHVTLRNVSRHDFTAFPFGITLSGGDTAVYIEAGGADRHHVMTTVKGAAPEARSSQIDLICTPFNRGDEYWVSLFVVIPDGRKVPSEALVSSSTPARLVETTSERLHAADLALAVGSVAGASVLGSGFEAVLKSIRERERRRP
jgi:hypothetical protein